jgi:hypothetical protein
MMQKSVALLLKLTAFSVAKHPVKDISRDIIVRGHFHVIFVVF